MIFKFVQISGLLFPLGVFSEFQFTGYIVSIHRAFIFKDKMENNYF